MSDLKLGDRVKTTNGPGTIVEATSWFAPDTLCVKLDCGSMFPLAFVPDQETER